MASAPLSFSVDEFGERFPRVGAPRLSGADRQPGADGFENRWDYRRERERHGVRRQSGSGDGAFGRMMMMEQSTRLVRAKAVSRCACHRSPRHAARWPDAIRKPERRQARHSCSSQNQTRFQAPSGAEYAAPTGLGNGVARVATKISRLTELSDGARLCPQDQSQRVEGRRRLQIFFGVWLRTCCG